MPLKPLKSQKRFDAYKKPQGHGRPAPCQPKSCLIKRLGQNRFLNLRRNRSSRSTSTSSRLIRSLKRFTTRIHLTIWPQASNPSGKSRPCLSSKLIRDFKSCPGTDACLLPVNSAGNRFRRSSANLLTIISVSGGSSNQTISDPKHFRKRCVKPT